MPCFFFEDDFLKVFPYTAMPVSHIGHMNTILYAFTEPSSKETCNNWLSAFRGDNGSC